MCIFNKVSTFVVAPGGDLPQRASLKIPEKKQDVSPRTVPYCIEDSDIKVRESLLSLHIMYSPRPLQK